MKEKLTIGLLMLAVIFTDIATNAAAQDAAAKALQLINQAREAIGGEKLKSLSSLSAAGNYRRTFGQGEMSGEVQFEMILPDKMLRTETLSPMPSMEITRIEAVNGDKVWSDQQTSGMGGGMVMIRRPGGDGPQGKAIQENAAKAEFARVTLGWLLSTQPAFPVEYSFAGEAEAPDGKADVIDVKGPNGFAVRLFLDQKTHRPLMLTYKGKKPRIITRSISGPHKSKEEIEDDVKAAEIAAAKEPDVEYQTRYSHYREVGGISFPHRLTRGIDGEVNEEWEMTKFKVNPQIKPEKFEKK